MAKPKPIDERIAEVARLAQSEPNPEARVEIRKALAASSNLIIAEAADAIRAWNEPALAEALSEAFYRLLPMPWQKDRLCLAKLAMIRALDALEHTDPAPFSAGIRCIQIEPAWGKPVDTAAGLRGQCARALARMGAPDAAVEIALLLMDPQPEALRAAVRAAGHLGGESAEVMLRMKALLHRTEAEIMEIAPELAVDCLSELMKIAPERSMGFVADFLQNEDPVLAEGAAIALGESRQEQAYRILHDHFMESIDSGFKKMLLLPIALIRSDASLGFLLAVLKEEHRGLAEAALEALRIYAGDEACIGRIAEAVSARDEPAVGEAFERVFGSEAER